MASTSGRPWIAGLTEASDFDDAPNGRSMFEGLDTSKADVMRASVGPVDHGIGLASQLVMQSTLDQSSHELRRRLSTLDDEVGDAARLPALGKGAVHGLDDVAAHAEIAQAALGLESDHPLPWCGGCGEAHLLEVLKTADHQAADLRIRAAGILGSKIDIPGLFRRQSLTSRSSRVQRSAETSLSSELRISCSGFGPSSIATNSSARERRPRLM
jgi:hypothetical protein